MRMAATIALGVSSCFTGLMALFCLFGAIVAPIAIGLDPHRSPDEPLWLAVVIYGGLFLIKAISLGVQLLGVRAINRADSYGLALVGTIAAFLAGVMCCNGFNLATGIFLVIALSNPKVREDFENDVAPAL